MTKPLPNLVGLRVGRWTVLRFAGRRNTFRYWECICDCGTKREIRHDALTIPRTRSCGCLTNEESSVRERTHGGSYKPEYRIWIAIRSRCNNPRNTKYMDYGGRGISVCERWDTSFQAFYEDMGPRPADHLEIERINNNGNYEPGNCRWATRREQMLNTRRVPMLTAHGVTLSSRQWAARTGIRQETIMLRLKRGWSHTRAVTEGVKKCSDQST